MTEGQPVFKNSSRKKAEHISEDDADDADAVYNRNDFGKY